MSQKVMLSLVFLLIVAIVVLLGYAVYAIYTGTSEEPDAATTPAKVTGTPQSAEEMEKAEKKP
jgi:flagellar basal body-associated protein FliL